MKSSVFDITTTPDVSPEIWSLGTLASDADAIGTFLATVKLTARP